MNIKSKVSIIVILTLLAIGGLFVLRSYYGDKLGIFADVLKEEKVILSREVKDGVFDSDKITNLEKVSDAYKVKSEALSPKCGSDITLEEIPQDATITLNTVKVEGKEEQNINSLDQSYYVGNELVEGTATKTISVVPSGDDIAAQPGEMSIARDSGSIQFKLNKPKEGTRNAFAGSIKFSDKISLNADSLSYALGGNGLEKPTDGNSDVSSENDEVKINAQDNNQIDFYLVTTTASDIFTIKYCIDQKESIEGKIAGQVDLGASKPLKKLIAKVENIGIGGNEILISSKLSNDGKQWLSFDEVRNVQLNYQDKNALDTFCFRYIKYEITLKSTNSSGISAGEQLLFKGFDIYGGDECGVSTGYDPGSLSLDTECSNGKDDDGDGKTDFPNDIGCSSKMDDSEKNPVSVCRAEDSKNISLKVNITKHKDGNLKELENLIYVGTTAEGLQNGSEFSLVAGGEPVRDSGISNVVTGLSVYRGEGYFYLHNQSDKEIESIEANFVLNGAKIIKVIDSDIENPFNGVVDFGNPLEDEAQIKVGSNQGKLITATNSGRDGVYVYYDYITSAGGGCQCQDGKDNDNNGKIDFPSDLGCESALDNEEVFSVAQKTEYPVCGNGLDDDKDGKTDYPDDTSCESILDGSELDSDRVCKVDENKKIDLVVSGIEVKNTEAGDVGNKIFAGKDKQYNEGEAIRLVTGSLPVIDDTIQEKAPGVSIKRGPGYVYVDLRNDPDHLGHELFKGRFSIIGAKIIKVINGSMRLKSSAPFYIGGPFENQGDNLFDETGQNHLQDEFTLRQENGIDFVDVASNTYGGSDSLYIYYDYEDISLGGCQCQDSADNDNDGLIDYPKDPGCSSLKDDSEIDKVIDIIKQPTKILPSVISSGQGFWVMIAIIVLISSISIGITLKNNRKRIV